MLVPPSPTPERLRDRDRRAPSTRGGGDRPFAPQLLQLGPRFPLRAAPRNQNAGKSLVTRLLPHPSRARPAPPVTTADAERRERHGGSGLFHVCPGRREPAERGGERPASQFPPRHSRAAASAAVVQKPRPLRSAGFSTSRWALNSGTCPLSAISEAPATPRAAAAGEVDGRLGFFICSGRIDPVPVSSSGPVVEVSEILLGLIMNPVKCEENEALGAAENDQTSGPEVTEDIVIKQTSSSTTVDPSPSDTGTCSSTIQREASLKIENPDLSRSDKCSFCFTFKSCSGKRDHSVFTACGGLNESIYSALRANENVLKRMENCFNKNIFVYGQEAIKGYINLGMPLKCLPKGSKLEISIAQRKGNQKEGDQILRHYENPSMECILFHVMAVGKNVRKIVNDMALHENASALCIYALKGETLSDALCKDGRFRSDLDKLEWKLIENHTNIHGKQSPVEEVAGKTLELDIPKKPRVGKCTPLKTEWKNENAAGEVSPYDVMPRQNQAHQPGNDGESEGVEHDEENVLPPRSLGNDLEGKKHRTISRIKGYYSDSNRKCGEQTSHAWKRPRLRMECAINWDIQGEATHHWVKNCTVLGNVIMLCNPRFSEDTLWMRKYFEEEQKRTELSLSQQFKIYEKCFAKVATGSIPAAACERLAQLSKSVGYVGWENNGITGNATCFVFNDGYIFTCRHVVHLMVGKDTHPSLWPDIISKCAKVTFTYKEFCPLAEEWFSLEPHVEVSAGDLDYAILKLRENGNGFPPGLVGQISSLPSYGLIYIIGHPEGRRKEIDPCAVITLQEREGRYSQLHQRGVAVVELDATTHDVFSMFTPRSFPPKAYRTDTLSYDTCFASGSSGSPVFNADGKVVALHSFGTFYKSEGKEHAFIEFGYSMDSILCDLKQRMEPLYKLLTAEKHENLNEEKSNKQDSSVRDDQGEPMEH